jgi:hypothetical protein
MKTHELMTACQEYYGLAYSPGQGKLVARYLDTLSLKLKSHLFVDVLKVHSATFKSLPDIAVFESALARAIESRDQVTIGAPMLTKTEERLATPEEIAQFNADMAAKGYVWRIR